MADVVRAVHRLAQRAQHHRLQQLHVRAGLDLFQQARVVLGVRLVAAGELQSELAQKLAQRRQLFRGRTFVHAVQRRMVVAGQEIGGADIGGQHAFLDQAVGIVALRRHDAFDLALVVEEHLGLDGFEVDRAAQCARLGQHLV